MSDLHITVRGTSVRRLLPELATASIAVVADGPEREHVVAVATTTAATVTASIEAAGVDASTGPITRWSSERVAVWSDRPWNADGRTLPLVHHASIAYSVEFADFDVLSRWLDELASIDGVSITGVSWGLTEQHAREVASDVQAEAVADAVAKAMTYATSVGLSSVRAVELADPGMLDHAAQGFASDSAPRAAMMMAGKHGGPELAITPAELEISASVDARFVAS